MNLLERAALDTGLKISKPEITEHFFPLPFSEYIVLQADAKFDSRKYSYWDEVLKLLAPTFIEKRLSVVTVGSPGELEINGTYNLVGKTTINQLAYIIRNSQLVVGPDSMACHIAGSYDVPLVALYPNMYPDQSRPYFGDKNKQVFIEPDRKDLKPSYSAQENPRLIDWIKPEVIAESILKLLNLNAPKFNETLYIGQYYKNRLIQNVPDQVVNLDGLGVDSLIQRMDFLHNEDNLAKQLSICKCSIITKRPINERLITEFKKQIVEVVYEIDEAYDMNFVKLLQKNGINYVLFTYKDEEWLNPIKLDFFDYKMVNLKPRITKDSIAETKDIPISSLIYKSNGFILSNGKIYTSKATWLIDAPIPNFEQNTCKAVDSSEFWNESESFYILKSDNFINLTNLSKSFRLEDIKL